MSIALVAISYAVGALALTGCGSSRVPVAATSNTSQSTTIDHRAQLTSKAASAKDRHFIAHYTLTTSTQRSKSVTVTVANDSTWRVDIPGGALGGTTDIALIGLPDGQYQCALNTDSGCAKIAASGRKISPSIDPLVQYPFTSWLDILTDPSVAITVTVTKQLSNATGTCYGIEPTTVTLAPPIESSTFCYTDDGTLTGVRAGFGTLILSGTPTAAPESMTLPVQVVSRPALPTARPSRLPISPNHSSITPNIYKSR